MRISIFYSNINQYLFIICEQYIIDFFTCNYQLINILYGKWNMYDVMLKIKKTKAPSYFKIFVHWN